MSTSDAAQVPIIDIGPLAGDGDSGRVAESIARACRSSGFFYVTGHAVDETLERNLEALSRRFVTQDLDTKMEILRRIPNLRKVSMNYRINIDRGAAALGTDYVFSYKPNPACFATDGFDLGTAVETATASALPRFSAR